jgi:hypothetical protein
MKTSVTVVMLGFALAATAASGEEKRVAVASPQPRLRLDPATRAVVVVEPVRVETKSAETNAVTMDKFVVKGRPLLMQGPAPLPPVTGKFTLLSGGVMSERELGALKLELGAWVMEDIIPDEAKFKAQKTRADFGFLRISW